MVSQILEMSLRQRMLIVIFSIMIAAGGVYAFRTIPIDAFPDVTSVLVQVVTKTPGLSPAEVERLVTYPIELQLTGVPSLTELRSLTKVGLSLVTIVFDDSMDINLARQLVLERLIEVKELLPPGQNRCWCRTVRDSGRSSNIIWKGLCVPRRTLQLMSVN